MLKAIKNFQKIKTVFIVVLVIAVIIFVFLVIAVNETGSYVQDNYIVVNKHSRVQGKQAFVREYTIATGDDTLAKIAGVDVFEERSVTFDTSNLEWSPEDYRNVVKHIAGTWIQQGVYEGSDRVRSLYENCISQFATVDTHTAYSREDFASIFGDINSISSVELYNTSGAKPYDFEVKSKSFTIQSNRCCCCLAESFCDYLCYFDTEGFGYSSKGHTGVIGLSESATKDGIETKDCTEGRTTKRRTCFTTYTTKPVGTVKRYIGLDLYTDIVGKTYANTTLGELQGLGYLEPGMIITYVSTPDNSSTGVPEACRHVEIITYIDKEYVYLAGAGDDQDILMNAVVGYNSVVRLDQPIFTGLDSACTNMYVGNIIPWYKSQSVKKTGGGLNEGQ